MHKSTDIERHTSILTHPSAGVWLKFRKDTTLLRTLNLSHVVWQKHSAPTTNYAYEEYITHTREPKNRKQHKTRILADHQC